MAPGITKIFGALNDSKRRLKRRDSDASVESVESSSSSSSTSTSSTSFAESSSSSSSPFTTPPSSPSIHGPDHDPLPDAEVDGLYSYPVHTHKSSSSYGSQHGDIDIDGDLLRAWNCSPPPERFQMKRMGRGSRGRVRPTLPVSEKMWKQQEQCTEQGERDCL